MEIIRKKICLENFKFHISGASLSDFGAFINDAEGIDIAGWKGHNGLIRGTDMIRRYNALLEIFRHSIHLKHTKNLSCNDTSAYYNKFYTNFDFNGSFDEFIFSANTKVFYESAFTNNDTYYTYNGSESDIEECDYVILISEEDSLIYSGYYGFDFVKEAHNIIYNGDGRFNKSPFIPINVLLVNNIDDIGLMSLYEDYDLDYEVENEGDYGVFPMDYSDDNKLDWFEKSGFTRYLEGPTPSYKEYSEDYPNLISKLTTLRDKLYIQDDNGKTLTAIFEDFSGTTSDKKGKFFKCYYCTGETIEETVITYVKESTATTWNYSTSSTTITEPWFKHNSFRNCLINLTKHSEDINTTTDINPDETVKTETTTKTIECSWWEPEETSGDDLSCADDEDINPNEEKYRTLTVFETLVYTLGETYTISDGDYFYFLIKYDNAEDIPARIPYSEGVVFNKDAYEYEDEVVYSGDKIESINYEGEYVEFTYRLGAIFSDDSYTNCTGGTIYKEKYGYTENNEGVISIDGFSGVSYWYNSIDFDGAKQQIINSDFNIVKNDNMSDIIAMTTGDIWKKDGSVYNTPLVKEDFLMGISMNGTTDINIEIDRGNAAAFESHFRLSECNSIDDIETNGNGGYFNIE